MDDRLPAQLSGGQQQRIAVARALAHRPEVLLMDEPFGALDAKIREELRRTIREIQRELGITTILVTHDQEEAFALADRIGVMHQGRLLECGRPDDLYTRPATRFVATFLGAANLLLGYRTRAAACASAPRRRPVATCRAKSWRCCDRRKSNRAPTSRRCDRISSGTATVEEVLFAGAVERLRVRMAGDGPVPVAPGREGAARAWGRCSRCRARCPSSAIFRSTPGSASRSGARRIHVLPTPISSFTAVAAMRGAARELRDSPLLATLGTACRRASRRGSAASSGRRPACRRSRPGAELRRGREWHLAHGAVQLLCVPPTAPLPNHVVIHTLDAESRRATLAVAASLLRHVAAEAIYLGIQPAASPRGERAAHMRDLLDARSAALAEHGLDMRTELRPGDVDGGTAEGTRARTRTACWCSARRTRPPCRGTGSADCSRATPQRAGADRELGARRAGAGRPERWPRPGSASRASCRASA